MAADFDTAVERARLAAADLLAAANQVITLRTMRPEDAEDDVDFAVLSRRSTSYAHSGMLDDAGADIDFATHAENEIAWVLASQSALAATGAEGAAAAARELIGRLDALADECQRRVVVLRS